MIGNVKRTYKGFVEIEIANGEKPVDAVFLVAVPDMMAELNRLQKNARIRFEVKQVNDASYLDNFRAIW